MRDGETWASIQLEVAKRCGVGDVECDCVKIGERLRSLAEALEVIIAVIIIAHPILRVVGRFLRAGKAVPLAKDVQKVDDLLTSSRELAEKNLTATRKALEELFGDAKIIIK